MNRRLKAIATAIAAIILVLTAVYAQDKYSLTSPGGIAFSDFRGYEDWSVVSSARTEEVLKVIVANPTMINAYKAGIPGNGQPFPDGSKIVKLQWKPKKSTEARSSWMCPMSLHRLSSLKRTASGFRKAAVGDTRYSTTKPHRNILRPIPRASQIVGTHAIQL